MKQITIDCRTISDSAQLHDLLARELAFPDWYGHNLDALFDCLTEVDEELELVLTGWNTLADWTGSFAEVLSDAAAENPNLTVLIK